MQSFVAKQFVFAGLSLHLKGMYSKKRFIYIFYKANLKKKFYYVLINTEGLKFNLKFAFFAETIYLQNRLRLVTRSLSWFNSGRKNIVKSLVTLPL